MVAKLLAILLLSIQVCKAQNPAQVSKFIQRIDNAENDSARVLALGELAEYYYIYRLESKADSILQKQLNIAELSHNKNLVFAALFGKAVANLSAWSSLETFDRTMKFIQQGLDYAIEAGRDDYTALAYIRKANLYRKRGQYNNAIQQATLAFSAIGNQQLDSIKTVLYLELGDIYKEKKNAVNAYNNFTNALSIAEKLKSIPLQSQVYHHLAELYQSLQYKELVKSNLLKSLQLNTLHKNSIGILNDYIDLARFTDERDYFDKSLLLADSLKSEYHMLLSKKIMFAYYMVISKSSKLALDYLNNNEELNQFYKNQGQATYYFTLGNIYNYSNVPDSALYYYRMAEPEMEKSFDIVTRRSVYREMGNCFASLSQYEKAIEYFEKALSLARSIGEYSSLSGLTMQLSKMYAKTNEFQKAYTYNQMYMHYQDSLKQMTNDRNLVLLEVKKDEERRMKEAEELAAKDLRKKNMQYIAITIATGLIFFLLILVGMFPISKLVIKILGFIGFICLFEFVILLIDAYLHELTHGEPLKIWMFKILVIAVLYPLHHFLEHVVVKFLASQKLLAMRKQFTLKNWWQTIKKPASKNEADLKSDTAVL